MIDEAFSFVEALALHNLLGKAAGILPEEIFVSPCVIDPTTGNKSLGVVVKRGEVSAIFAVGIIREDDIADFDAKWRSAVNSWNALSPEKRNKIIDETVVRERIVEILLTLSIKGFKNASGN